MRVPWMKMYMLVMFYLGPVMSVLQGGLNNRQVVLMCGVVLEAARIHVQNQAAFAAMYLPPPGPPHPGPGPVRHRVARRIPRARAMWCRRWLSTGSRLRQGQFANLRVELVNQDPETYRKYMRMTPEFFNYLLERLRPHITKKDTKLRKPLSPSLKLCITLRHLACGHSYRDMQFQFRVPHNTISLVVREVCDAFITVFRQEAIATPTTQDGWRTIAQHFSTRWNFHHTLGALDGKHVRIKCPPKGGSRYFNYKKFHSIVLMGLVDAHYRFIWVDIGAYGSMSDAQVFNDTYLCRAIKQGTIGFPDPDPLPHDNTDMPYFIVGDNIFGLKKWLMKPFSHLTQSLEERIFSYRLSRARRVVENAFGIMANRWRILLTTMQHDTSTVEKITLTCCILHNLLRTQNLQQAPPEADGEDEDGNIIPGVWRNGAVMADCNPPPRGHNDYKAAKAQRQTLKHYYNSPVGAVPWQRRAVRATLYE